MIGKFTLSYKKLLSFLKNSILFKISTNHFLNKPADPLSLQAAQFLIWIRLWSTRLSISLHMKETPMSDRSKSVPGLRRKTILIPNCH